MDAVDTCVENSSSIVDADIDERDIMMSASTTTTTTHHRETTHSVCVVETREKTTFVGESSVNRLSTSSSSSSFSALDHAVSDGGESEDDPRHYLDNGIRFTNDELEVVDDDGRVVQLEGETLQDDDDYLDDDNMRPNSWSAADVNECEAGERVNHFLLLLLLTRHDVFVVSWCCKGLGL